VFLCLALITHYILLFLKSFRYCINIIKYIYIIYIILEIFSCDFLKRRLLNVLKPAPEPCRIIYDLSLAKPWKQGIELEDRNAQRRHADTASRILLVLEEQDADETQRNLGISPAAKAETRMRRNLACLVLIHTF